MYSHLKFLWKKVMNAKHTVIFFSIIFALRLEDFPLAEAKTINNDIEIIALVGCWDVKSIKSYSRRLCFAKSGRVYYQFMEPSGDGGDDAFDWRIEDSRIYVKDEKCAYEQIGDSLLIKDCAFKGAWYKQCSIMLPTKDGCAQTNK